MSLDLSVRCSQEFTVGDLCYQAGQALMETLGLTHIPDLSVDFVEGGQSIPAENEFICGTQSPLLLVGFRDMEGKIKLLLYDVPQKPGSAEAPGLRTNILSGEGNTKAGEPLRMALGASVAMGLARLQESLIKDNRLFFGQAAELSPEELRRALRQHGLFRDIQDAAQKMFFRAPLSAFEPEALRALQIEEQIDKVMVEMLGMIKISHRVDAKLFSKFYSLLDEVVAGNRMDEERKGNLMGLLLLIYEYLREEAKRLSEPAPLYEEAERVKDKMRSMGLELP